MSLWRLGRGKRPANGGVRMLGSRKSGTWNLFFGQEKGSANVACIACISMPSAVRGLCAGCTTDVHGITCAVGVQFSGRRLRAGRSGEYRERPGNERDGAARPGWCVRFTAISSGRRKNGDSSAYRSGSRGARWVEISSSGGDARGLSEFVPFDHAHEDACEKRARTCFSGGDERSEQRADLFDWRNGRAAGGCSDSRWIGRGGKTRAGIVRHVWSRQCLRRVATAFLPRGRSSEPSCCGDRAKAEAAAAGDQRCVLRAGGATRSVGRLHLYPASPDAGHRRAVAQPKLRTTSEVAGRNDEAICGFARGHCEYAGTFRPVEVCL